MTTRGLGAGVTGALQGAMDFADMFMRMQGIQNQQSNSDRTLKLQEGAAQREADKTSRVQKAISDYNQTGDVTFLQSIAADAPDTVTAIANMKKQPKVQRYQKEVVKDGQIYDVMMDESGKIISETPTGKTYLHPTNDAATKTVEVGTPDGKLQKYQWNPQTNSYDKPVGSPYSKGKDSEGTKPVTRESTEYRLRVEASTSEAGKQTALKYGVKYDPINDAFRSIDGQPITGEKLQEMLDYKSEYTDKYMKTAYPDTYEIYKSSGRQSIEDEIMRKAGGSTK